MVDQCSSLNDVKLRDIQGVSYIQPIKSIAIDEIGSKAGGKIWEKGNPQCVL